MSATDPNSVVRNLNSSSEEGSSESRDLESTEEQFIAERHALMQSLVVTKGPDHTNVRYQEQELHTTETSESLETEYSERQLEIDIANMDKAVKEGAADEIKVQGYYVDTSFRYLPSNLQSALNLVHTSFDLPGSVEDLWDEVEDELDDFSLGGLAGTDELNLSEVLKLLKPKIESDIIGSNLDKKFYENQERWDSLNQKQKESLHFLLKTLGEENDEKFEEYIEKRDEKIDKDTFVAKYLLNPAAKTLFGKDLSKLADDNVVSDNVLSNLARSTFVGYSGLMRGAEKGIAGTLSFFTGVTITPDKVAWEIPGAVQIALHPIQTIKTIVDPSVWSDIGQELAAVYRHRGVMGASMELFTILGETVIPGKAASAVGKLAKVSKVARATNQLKQHVAIRTMADSINDVKQGVYRHIDESALNPDKILSKAYAAHPNSVAAVNKYYSKFKKLKDENPFNRANVRKAGSQSNSRIFKAVAKNYDGLGFDPLSFLKPVRTMKKANERRNQRNNHKNSNEPGLGGPSTRDTAPAKPSTGPSISAKKKEETQPAIPGIASRLAQSLPAQVLSRLTTIAVKNPQVVALIGEEIIKRGPEEQNHWSNVLVQALGAGEAINVAKFLVSLPPNVKITNVLEGGRITLDVGTPPQSITANWREKHMYPSELGGSTDLEYVKFPLSSDFLPAVQLTAALVAGNSLGSSDKVTKQFKHLHGNFNFREIFQHVYRPPQKTTLTEMEIQNWKNIQIHHGGLQNFLSTQGVLDKKGAVIPEKVEQQAQFIRQSVEQARHLSSSEQL